MDNVEGACYINFFLTFEMMIIIFQIIIISTYFALNFLSFTIGSTSNAHERLRERFAVITNKETDGCDLILSVWSGVKFNEVWEKSIHSYLSSSKIFVFCQIWKDTERSPNQHLFWFVLDQNRAHSSFSISIRKKRCKTNT